MNAMPGGNRVNRVDALQGIKTNLGFEPGTVLASFLGPMDRRLGLWIDDPLPVQFSGTTSDLHLTTFQAVQSA
jgi:hypothetical protein